MKLVNISFVFGVSPKAKAGEGEIKENFYYVPSFPQRAEMLTKGEEMDGRHKLPSVKARKVCETISLLFTSAVLRWRMEIPRDAAFLLICQKRRSIDKSHEGWLTVPTPQGVGAAMRAVLFRRRAVASCDLQEKPQRALTRERIFRVSKGKGRTMWARILLPSPRSSARIFGIRAWCPGQRVSETTRKASQGQSMSRKSPCGRKV